MIAAASLALIASISTRDLSAHDRVTTAVTWEREIAPIVVQHCLGCHSGRPGSTVSLASYEAARPWARAIRQQVLTRRMPIWRAARGYGEFANDLSLSPFEITLVAAWADGGAPKAPSAGSTVLAAASEPLPLFAPPRSTREQMIACGNRATPAGVLLGMRPQLEAGGSVRVTASWPNGDRRILGWFRDVDPADQTVYWLGTEIDPRPGVSILATSAASGSCALVLTLR